MASDLQFIIAAWNTGLVKKEEEPKQYEDFADPRWKNRLIAEPRDLEMLMGFAKYKYKSDEKAIDIVAKDRRQQRRVSFRSFAAGGAAGGGSGGGLFDLLLPSLSQPHQEGRAGQLYAE